MNEEIVGSHEKAKNGYGQNGYQGPSSVQIGKQPKLGEASVAPPVATTVNTNHADDQARLDAVNKPGVPVHDGMPRTPSILSGHVPATNTRRDSGKKLLGK